MYQACLRPRLQACATPTAYLCAACRFQLPEWTAVHGGWAVSVLNGHLNFHVTPASTTDKAPALVSHCLHADGDADDAADARHAPDQAPLPQPTTTATVLKHDSSQAPAGTKPEADKAPAGNSPHGSLGNMWSGTALGCSLKQAIADQPSRSSAHPTDLGCNPAEENLTVTAHQEPALVVTVTKPPAALPSTLALPQTVLQVPSTESASGYKGLTADNTFAAGLTTQKSHGRGQPGGPSSTAAATQGTGASDAGGGGVAARGGAAVGVAAVTGGKAAVVAAGAGAGAGAAAQRGPGRAEAGSQAVAAKAEADATADRGSNDEPIAGRAPCSGGHSQGGHPPRHLDIRMVPAGPELVEVEYPLYYKYQIFNHHDKPSKVC